MFKLNIETAQVVEIVCLLYLLVLSVQDIRRHAVSVRFLAAGAVLAVTAQLVWKEQTFLMCAAGMTAGLLFVGLSRLTEEGIGYGDSILITILGFYIGAKNLLYLLGIAFAIAAVFSVCMLAASRWNKKTSFPFIPFITAGYIVLLILRMI